MTVRYNFSFRKYGKNWYGGMFTDLDYITEDQKKYVVGIHQNYFFTLPENFDFEAVYSMVSDADEGIPTFCTIRYTAGTDGAEVTLRDPEKFDRYESTSFFSETGKEEKTITKMNF